MWGLLILITYIAFVQSRLSEQFHGCTRFFVDGIEPSGFQDEELVDLCQNRNYEIPHDVLATKYDESRKIPVYSAYILDRHVEGGRPKSWNIEQQIPSSKQAHDHDYKHNEFDRGHLCPSIYISKNNRPAAFTLTNAVPQYPIFNQHRWNKAEYESKKIMLESCGEGTAYFITGAIPGEKYMKTKRHKSDTHKIDTGVVVPTYLFTAACCRLDGGASFSLGFLGNNVIVNATVSVMDVMLLGRIVKERHPSLKEPIVFFHDTCDSSNKTYVSKMAKAMGVAVTNKAALQVALSNKYYSLIISCCVLVVSQFGW